jgi:hypothetical protein
MIRTLCIATSAGLILLMTGCATPGSAEWNSMRPPPPSGDYADG